MELAEKSWDELWSELLGTDFEIGFGTTNNPDTIQGENFVNSGYNVQADIEDWAGQSFGVTSQTTHHSFDQFQEQQLPDVPIPSELVCYGMVSSTLSQLSTILNLMLTGYRKIYRVSTKAMGNMCEIDSILKETGQRERNSHYLFKIAKSVTNVFLQFQDGTNFALLNSHASTGLLNVIDLPGVELDALGSLQPIRETLGRATKASDATVRVEINVYGPSSSLASVGKQFSDNQIFLQRPDRPRPGLKYQNPHLLRFGGLETPALELVSVVDRDGAPVSKDHGLFQKTITNVYASLTRGAHLERVDGDRRLKTKLLL